MSYGSASEILIGNSDEDKAAIQALQRLQLPQPLHANLSLPSLGQVCGAYNTAAPAIRAVLPAFKPLLVKLPKGSIVVSALETLMTIADLACIATPNAALLSSATTPVVKTDFGAGASHVWIGASEEDRQAIRALEAITVPDEVHAALALPSLDQACKAYNTVAPVLKLVLPLIQPLIAKIPKGDVIASGLTTLMSVADVACAVPQLQVAAVPSRLTILPSQRISLTEDSGYQSAKISNGYGLVTKAGVQVQRGVTAHLNVSFDITTVSDDTFKSWLDSQKSVYTDQEHHTLEENYAAGGFLGGVLCGCFGLAIGGGTYNHYKNQTDQVFTENDKTKSGFLKSLQQLQTSHVTVTGSIDAVGQSYQPVEGFIYVETTTIEFRDGSSLTCVNTNAPVAADANGDTSGVQASPNQTLHILKPKR